MIRKQSPKKMRFKANDPNRDCILDKPLFYIGIALFSICGVLIVLFATEVNGPGLTTDSVYYISFARNLADGEGLYSFDGSPMLSWPPLYSVILSIPAFLGSNVMSFARWFNAFLFGALIFLSIIITAKATGSRICALIAGLFILSSSTLLNTALTVWSELTFIVFILLTTFFAQKIDIAEKSITRHIVLFGIATALACMTRYAGVAVYLAGVLFLITSSKTPFKKKLYIASIYSIVSLFPVAAWVFRNFIMHGSMTGARSTGKTGIIENIVLVVRQTAYALFYNNGLVGVIALTIAVTLTLITGWKIFRESSRWVYILLFVPVYLTFIVATSSFISFDAIYDRLLSPIVPFTIITIACAFVEGAKSLSKVLRTILIFLLIAWAVNSIVFTTQFVKKSRTVGVGFYSLKMFRESPLLNRIIEIRPTGRIFSNFPDLLYIKADVEALWTPLADGSRRELLDDLEAGKRVNIIWFYYTWGRAVNITEFLDPDDEITIHEEFRDGWIGTYPAVRRTEFVK